MSEYTYKDVIIDPEDPRVEIGKEYWFANTPNECVWKANERRDTWKLEKVSHNDYAFYASGARWVCITRKKEPEKRYVPFDLNSEKDRDFLRGKWMRSKNLDEEGFIDYFWKIDREGVDVWKAHMSNHGVIYAHHLLSNYVFLDGSPVGKLVEVTDGN